MSTQAEVQAFLEEWITKFDTEAIVTGHDIVISLRNLDYDELSHKGRSALRAWKKMNRIKRERLAAKVVLDRDVKRAEFNDEFERFEKAFNKELAFPIPVEWSPSKIPTPKKDDMSNKTPNEINLSDFCVRQARVFAELVQDVNEMGLGAGDSVIQNMQDWVSASNAVANLVHAAVAAQSIVDDVNINQKQFMALKNKASSLISSDKIKRAIIDADAQLKNGMKIGAIKAIREHINLSLKDAKDFVEQEML